MMNVINDTLEQRGLLLKGGTMVDATKVSKCALGVAGGEKRVSASPSGIACAV